jgi:hypothetical protein
MLTNLHYDNSNIPERFINSNCHYTIVNSDFMTGYNNELECERALRIAKEEAEGVVYNGIDTDFGRYWARFWKTYYRECFSLDLEG